MYCTQCGTEAVPGGRFCAQCGASIITMAPDKPPGSTVATPEPETNTVKISKAKPAPSGIGGWLFLLVAALLVLGPLLGAGRVNVEIITAEDRYPTLRSLAEWQTHKTVTWWAFLDSLW